MTIRCVPWFDIQDSRRPFRCTTRPCFMYVNGQCPSQLHIRVLMRRVAASGIAACIRSVRSPAPRASLAGVVHGNGKARGPSYTFGTFAGSSDTDSLSSWNKSAPAATLKQGMRLSSKSSSDESSEQASDSKIGSEQSSAADAALANTLVSSAGSSPSLLTGPRITSKKGYLEREGMISETQKAVREYYKAGMYQVSRHALIRYV